MKKKLLIFANCHGAVIKDALQRAGFGEYYTFEHIVSYENLSNFDQLRSRFEQADLLILQPVESYPQFSVENLGKIVKAGCEMMIVPFVRFEGFWPKYDSRTLQNISSAAVMFFPKVFSLAEVEPYLSGVHWSDGRIRATFDEAMEKLAALERQGSVKFVDFFETNYRRVPLFRDPYHPTEPFYSRIVRQIVQDVGALHPTWPSARAGGDPVLTWKKEFGHYKPMTDRFSQVLGLEFDIESYFVYERRTYIESIVEFEANGQGKIQDLKGLKDYIDQRTTHRQANAVTRPASQCPA